MTDTTRFVEWSPADSPAAIAVSESSWWFFSVRLTIQRLSDNDDCRVPFNSHQIDARFLVFALRQLLTAEQLMQKAVREPGVAPEVSTVLAQARQQFEDAMPGIKRMRDALMHFEDWSRGTGSGPQHDRSKAGEAPRDIAEAYWSFAYDPIAGTVSLGPYTINVAVADRAAAEMRRAIYRAGREIDKTASLPDEQNRPIQ
ncbi:hypothetical protein [Nocardia vinacea]|uniref:hypothetical protein n=1 Tax=Nocardia vinacea TaxID=96468 RepID=UPI0012F6BB39|nr:hypothetical protein [Nocardia vinacea]